MGATETIFHAKFVAQDHYEFLRGAWSQGPIRTSRLEDNFRGVVKVREYVFIDVGKFRGPLDKR